MMSTVIMGMLMTGAKSGRSQIVPAQPVLCVQTQNLVGHSAAQRNLRSWQATWLCRRKRRQAQCKGMETSQSRDNLRAEDYGFTPRIGLFKLTPNVRP